MQNTKAKKIIKTIINCIIFLIVFALVMGYIAYVCKRKNSNEKYDDFFSQEEDFDVLFFGSSRVLNGIYPMELWEDYGMVSYNFGGHGNYIPVSYWVWKNSMDYNKPKLVVIDATFIQENKPYRENTQQVHLSVDSFPLTKTKYDMVEDLFGDPDSDFYDNRYEFLFPFGSYHDRWNELTSDDFVVNDSPEKGAEMRIDVAKMVKADWLKEEDPWLEETLAKKYLRQWIKECKEQDIEVLLVQLPYAATRLEQTYSQGVEALAKELDVNYVNMLYEDVVNYHTDFYDTDGHLNPSGARKVTDYLGRYISENYDIPDHGRDEEYSFWYDDYQEYKNYKISLLKSQKYLETYLMLLNDSDLSCEIYINSASKLLEDEKVMQLIENLTESVEVENNGNYVEQVDGTSWDYDMEIIVNDLENFETIDDVKFTISDDTKPSDEALDNAIFFANDSYIKYGSQ